MTWETVRSKIIFWDSVNGVTWVLAGPTVTDVSAGQQVLILHYLEEVYIRSGTARDFLELVALLHDNIRIGTSVNAVAFGTYSSVSYLGIDLSKIPLTFYMNDRGNMVPERPGLAILHEMQHMVWGLGAGDPSGGHFAENGAGYDHDGRPVAFQNTVAREMGWFDDVQSSYWGIRDSIHFSRVAALRLGAEKCILSPISKASDQGDRRS